MSSISGVFSGFFSDWHIGDRLKSLWRNLTGQSSPAAEVAKKRFAEPPPVEPTITPSRVTKPQPEVKTHQVALNQGIPNQTMANPLQSNLKPQEAKRAGAPQNQRVKKLEGAIGGIKLTQASNEQLKLLEKFVSLREQIPSAKRSLFKQAALIAEFKEVLSGLGAQKFSQLDLLNLLYQRELKEPNKQLLSKLSQYVRKMESNPNAFSHPKDTLGADADHLISYLIIYQKHLLMEHLLDGVGGVKLADRLLFHALLDSMVWGEETGYEGSDVVFTGPVLERHLVALLDGRAWEAELGELPDLLKTTIAPLLKQVALIGYGHVNPSDRAQLVSQRIRKLAIGEKALIPVGSQDHATLVLVERTAKDTARLVHYNTGDGLDISTRLPGTYKAQTFEVIEGVSFQHLQRSTTWAPLFELVRSEEDMEPIEAHLRENLGKGGRLLPPSPHVEDHEEMQHQGTCGFQTVMAFLRHQVMEQAAGTKEERLAAYQLIKSRLFLQVAYSHGPEASPDIVQVLKTPLAKLKAEEKMEAIAKDDKRFAAASRSFIRFLNSVGEEDLAKRLASANTFVLRYALLRKASAVKAAHWHREGKRPTNPTPSEALAVARYEHHKLIDERHRLRVGLAGSDWKLAGRRLGQMIVESPLPHKGIAFAVKHFTPESEGYALAMNNLVRYLQRWGPEYIPELQEAYRKAGLNNTADSIGRVPPLIVSTCSRV